MSSTSSGAQDKCVCARPKVVIIACSVPFPDAHTPQFVAATVGFLPRCAGVAFNDDVEPCGYALARDTRAACAKLLPSLAFLPSPAYLSSSVSMS
ncbi:hypothetical protein MRX96_043524 [Rhipicephalus microplus]